MTDPRYAAPDVTDSAAAPEPGPQGPSDDGAQGPSDDGSGGRTDGNRQGPSDSSRQDASDSTPQDPPDAAVKSEHDPQATTELPRTGWGSASGAEPAAESGTQSDSQSTGQNWSSEQTQNFPAYRPQSYPTYPPTHAQTSELPAVGAGGPPPTTAAAYGGPGPGGPRAGAPGVGPGGSSAGPTGAQAMASPAFAGATAAEPDRARRRGGAGLAGALGLIGLAAAAYGAFALPIQKLGPRRSPYFVTLRELSTEKAPRTAHGSSLAGGHAATLWWRYGLAGALGVLAVLLLVQLWVPVLRRVAGVLLFLGALATIAGYAVALHQTTDYRRFFVGIQDTPRVPISQLGLGIWVAVAGCGVAALGGLIAAVQSTRR